MVKAFRVSIRPPCAHACNAIFMDKKLLAGCLMRLKVLAGMDIAEKQAPQDGRFTY